MPNLKKTDIANIYPETEDSAHQLNADLMEKLAGDPWRIQRDGVGRAVVTAPNWIFSASRLFPY